MTVFLTTCLLFGVALVVHFILWRLRCPRHEYTALFVIFGAGLAAWLAFALWHSTALWQLLQTALFYTATCLAYVVAYSSVEGDSPTLSLMRFIAENETAGRSHDEVRRFFAERPFARSRLAALMDAGLVREENGRYVVAGRGSFAFRSILIYRRIYGNVPRGG